MSATPVAERKQAAAKFEIVPTQAVLGAEVRGLATGVGLVR